MRVHHNLDDAETCDDRAHGVRAVANGFALASTLLALAGCQSRVDAPDTGTRGAVATAGAPSAPIYPTYGVHNPPSASPCQARDCTYVRGKGEPADPLYPAYWVSNWTMYRVFGAAWQQFPPPIRVVRRPGWFRARTTRSRTARPTTIRLGRERPAKAR